MEFSDGKRYIRAYIKEGDSKIAIAFFDKRRGVWLNAASWRKPSNRVYAKGTELTAILSQS